MKKKILAGLLLAGTAAFAAPRFSVGVGFGAPDYTAPGYYANAVPPSPGPGYEFINGYWQYVGAPVVVHDNDDYYGQGVRDRGHFNGDHFDRDRSDRSDYFDQGNRSGHGDHFRR